jgi:hypothetical protein
VHGEAVDVDEAVVVVQLDRPAQAHVPLPGRHGHGRARRRHGRHDRGVRPAQQVDGVGGQGRLGHGCSSRRAVTACPCKHEGPDGGARGREEVSGARDPRRSPAPDGSGG